MNRHESTLANNGERKLANLYSPFRDPNPPNYLKYGKPVNPSKDETPKFVAYRFGLRVEFRGTVPGGVMNYFTKPTRY